jgi:hypothetical protein
MNWITAAEFARRMKCSRANVTQGIKGGRIAAEHVRRDGTTVRISSEAIPSWLATASKRRPKAQSPAEAAGPPAAPAKAPGTDLPVLAWGQTAEDGERKLSPEELEAEVANLPPGAVPELGLSRQRREHALAQLAELELKERESLLVAKADVERVWFEEGRRVRDAIQRLGPVMLPDLAKAAGGLNQEQRAEVLLVLERHHVGALKSLADCG